MKTVSKQQKRIIQAINEDAELSHWRDWRWQMRHCVRDLDTFEELLGVQIDAQMRVDFARTVERFPMSVTPLSHGTAICGDGSLSIPAISPA